MVINRFRADFTYEGKNNIIIIDYLDLGNRSVTNDIENVIANIKRKMGIGVSGFAIPYRDSMGIWDRIRISPSGQVSFYGLGETEEEKATARLLHIIP